MVAVLYMCVCVHVRVCACVYVCVRATCGGEHVAAQTRSSERERVSATRCHARRRRRNAPGPGPGPRALRRAASGLSVPPPAKPQPSAIARSLLSLLDSARFRCRRALVCSLLAAPAGSLLLRPRWRRSCSRFCCCYCCCCHCRCRSRCWLLATAPLADLSAPPPIEKKEKKNYRNAGSPFARVLPLLVESRHANPPTLAKINPSQKSNNNSLLSAQRLLSRQHPISANTARV